SPVLVPRPSLSLHLSQWVSLGDNVTLRCHLPRSAAQVELYTEGYWWYVKQADMDMVQDTAEFLLVSVERKDAVKYHCRYRVLEPPGTSEKSDPVEQVVTDPKLPPPSISMSSGSNVGTGTNVTIWCSNQENRGTIFLHEDGHSAPVQL
ncbi:osteoclast-associated immunoglobulin-like receptor, partial [Phasianus colchicus]|uniref:osteoclast-associated immunoglobulin-like receptor n=1 Tax=Phasianus colchicus TaxID=9054 RepID=UPI00129DE738